jgi:hypothetical protein
LAYLSTKRAAASGVPRAGAGGPLGHVHRWVAATYSASSRVLPYAPPVAFRTQYWCTVKDIASWVPVVPICKWQKGGTDTLRWRLVCIRIDDISNASWIHERYDTQNLVHRSGVTTYRSYTWRTQSSTEAKPRKGLPRRSCPICLTVVSTVRVAVGPNEAQRRETTIAHVHCQGLGGPSFGPSQ